MAIYHLSVKTISRGQGRSAPGSAAYRAGEKIRDERTGKEYDYTDKPVAHAEIIGWDGTRSELWNAAEKSENRKDSVTAREYEAAIPVELDKADQVSLIREYATWLNERHGVAVDFAIHRNTGNPHAHIMTTTRRVFDEGFTTKTEREWSDSKRKQNGLPGRKSDLVEAREVWSEMVNASLREAGTSDRVTHRSHSDRGLDLVPQIHLGKTVLQFKKQGISHPRLHRYEKIKSQNAKIISFKDKRDQLDREIAFRERFDHLTDAKKLQVLGRIKQDLQEKLKATGDKSLQQQLVPVNKLLNEIVSDDAKREAHDYGNTLRKAVSRMNPSDAIRKHPELVAMYQTANKIKIQSAENGIDQKLTNKRINAYFEKSIDDLSKQQLVARQR
jgi:hypothetical protein